MSSQSSGLLGRSVIGNLVSASKKLSVVDEPIALPLSKIHQWEDQPRQYFSKNSVAQLADSFKKHGFKGAVVVRPHPKVDDVYQLVAGERRIRAAEAAGIDNVLCFVGNFTEEEALDFALGENLHREDLSKLEEATGLLRLIQTRYGIEQSKAIEVINTEGHNERISARSNVTTEKSPLSVELRNIVTVLDEFGIGLQTFRTAHLPTLKLPDNLKKAHLEENLSYLSAKAIAQLKDEEKQSSVLAEVLEEGLSVRDVRARVKELLSGKKSEPKRSKKSDKLGSDLTELKTVANQLSKSRKLIVEDAEKMKKIKRILSQLRDLLPDVFD